VSSRRKLKSHWSWGRKMNRYCCSWDMCQFVLGRSRKVESMAKGKTLNTGKFLNNCQGKQAATRRDSEAVPSTWGTPSTHLSVILHSPSLFSKWLSGQNSVCISCLPYPRYIFSPQQPPRFHYHNNTRNLAPVYVTEYPIM